MGVKQIDEIVSRFGGELTDEEAFYLWERWRRYVKHDAIQEWQETIWTFAEHAVKSGFNLGMSVLRSDTSLPFSPENCYFDYGRADNAARAKTQKETNTLDRNAAADWNRNVYEPNREIVAQYKRRHGIPDAATQGPREENDPRNCAWCHDEFCVNGECPVRGDYCPTGNFPGLCRFDSRGRDY